MSKDILYEGTVNASNTQDTKHLISITSSAILKSDTGIILNLSHPKNFKRNELSKHDWHLKQSKTDLAIGVNNTTGLHVASTEVALILPMCFFPAPYY